MNISQDYKFILIKTPTKKGSTVETYFSRFAVICDFLIALLLEKEDRFGQNYRACFNPFYYSLKFKKKSRV